MDIDKFKKDLEQFTGTEQYYKLGLYETLATDGVLFFCQQAEAFWLFDEIAHFVKHKTKEPFVVADVISWDTDNGHLATIKFTDGNDNELGGKIIDFTDLPVGEWKFFVQDNVCMLPSEY